jgi:hypothetical protein
MQNPRACRPRFLAMGSGVYCAKIVTSGKSVRGRFKARNAASDSCAAPVPGIRSTAIDPPEAVTTRPVPAVFTRPDRSQKPGSVTLPRATAVLPKVCSAAGWAGAASAAAFCAAVVVSSAIAVRAPLGGGIAPAEFGRVCGCVSIGATGSIAAPLLPINGKWAQPDSSSAGRIRAFVYFILVTLVSALQAFNGLARANAQV